ncbi:ATP-binding protein [Xylophilus ampelinus]|uniref:histidine kinase n=1 Tax=Xylophilus ampelinus TaxID=54067 RepID=A0A318SEX9_9BURK|nr:ATP-binding protein [Xylophilus ampelinus]MCS4511481.1 ATP-binding protein [Xylophilus ampelinus]PYE74821.1 protein-histidine pros-kinase [Xylophilus ampelinus]
MSTAAPSPRTCRKALGARIERLLPATLFGRLVLLLFVTALASHLLALTLLVELQPDGPADPRQGGGAPPAMPAGPADGGAGLRRPRGGEGPLPFAPPGVRTSDFRGGPPPAGGPFGYPGLVMDIGVRLLALLLAAWVGARWLSQPVRRLAAAARELGRDIHRAPLAEDGTVECREATRVFNGMQAQIRRQLDDRNRFVAAVSHDLRTPLTRLRLRAEVLEHAADRESFGRDIREMDAMIRSTLDYLTGEADPEAHEPLDLPALLTSIADDLCDVGHTVRVSGTAVPLRLQPLAMRRCISNLVENAIRYGGSAGIAVHDGLEGVRIEVADPGPGIPEAELEKVMAPFYRLDASRNRHSGGVGLGLSIAHDIAVRHGGRLTLRNRAAGGLVATLELPRDGRVPPAGAGG